MNNGLSGAHAIRNCNSGVGSIVGNNNGYNISSNGNSNASIANTTNNNNNSSVLNNNNVNGSAEALCTNRGDQPDPDFIKMFVGQVPKSMDEDQLREMFEEFGRVHSINVLRDKVTGVSKGNLNWFCISHCCSQKHIAMCSCSTMAFIVFQFTASVEVYHRVFRYVYAGYTKYRFSCVERGRGWGSEDHLRDGGGGDIAKHPIQYASIHLSTLITLYWHKSSSHNWKNIFSLVFRYVAVIFI